MKTLQKKSLFWDIDLDTLDQDQHRRFIIERILARGDEADFLWARDAYGMNPLKKVFLTAKSLNPKSVSFWNVYFNIDTDICTRKPSLLKRAAFWKK